MYNVLKIITLTSHIVVYYHNVLLGVQQSIQLPISTAVTTNTQSLLSSDQHHVMLPSKCINDNDTYHCNCVCTLHSFY